MNLKGFNEQHIFLAENFEELLSKPFHGEINASCWSRKLEGDFFEIMSKVKLTGNITNIEVEELHELELTEHGSLARNVILKDFNVLSAHGALPQLNVIKYYDRDDEHPFFPTDVYSFHVDSSPIASDTFLCTYYGAPSEILPNAQAEKKVLIPEIRAELKKRFVGKEEDFESYLHEHSYDLHYEAKPNSCIISLGVGNMWRMAVKHPQALVAPCIHRAPKESFGQFRLMMIC